MLTNVLPFFCVVSVYFVCAQIEIFQIKQSKIQRNFLFCSLVLLLMIFAGGRWSSWVVGYDAWIFDYDSYHTIFDDYSDLISFLCTPYSTSFGTEYGYLFLNALIHTFTDNYNYFLLIVNCLSVWLLLLSFKKNNIHYGLFLIMYFFVSRLYFQYNFTLMRQSIAMVIVWYAFHFLSNRKYIAYYLFVLIASSFHISALICLFIPFLSKLNIKLNHAIWFILVMLLINQLGLINKIFINIIHTFLPAVNERLIQYLMMEDKLNLLSFIEGIPFLYMANKYSQQILQQKEGKLFFNMLLVYLMLLSLTSNFSFMTRMWQYLIFSYMYILSFYYKQRLDVNRNLVLRSLSFYLLIYSTRYIMMWFYNTPFSFFLFNE